MRHLSSHRPSGEALVIAHEIWGVNEHMMLAAEFYRRHTQFTVVTPSYVHAGGAGREESAVYREFTRSLGVEGLVERLAADVMLLREEFTQVHGIGFSVGATAVWTLAQRGLVDSAVCVYGSRIRERLLQPPKSRTLVVMAEHEASFDPWQLLPQLDAFDNVATKLVEGTTHGYCNPDHPKYDSNATAQTYDAAIEFLRGGAHR